MSTDFIKPKHSFRRWYVYAFIFALITILAFYQSLQILAAPPTVATVSSSGITETTATLSGQHTGNNSLSITNRGFEYGTTVGYGSSVSEAAGIFVDTFGETELATPVAVGVNNGYVYVVDQSANNIKVYNSDGVYQPSMNFGLPGGGDVEFGDPYDIAFDSSDNIYILDATNERIQKLDPTGTSKLLEFPISSNAALGITVDSSGNIYVVDPGSDIITKYDSLGVSQLVIDDQGGLFNVYSDVAINSSGDIYVSSNATDQVAVFDASGAFLTTIGTSGSGDGQLNGPFRLSIDEDDNLYVGDLENFRIQRFDSSGTFDTLFGSFGSTDGEFSTMYGMAIDEYHNIYGSDIINLDVQKFSLDYSLGLTGLTCGTTYHYRAFATNSDGTGNSADDTFTTDDCPAAPSSSGGGGSSGTHFICTDPTATNYSDPDEENGKVKNSICRYPEKLACSVEPYLTKAVKLGANNDASDVIMLEKFLNTYENASLPINGIYEKADYYHVIAWQEKYPDEILRPWGLRKGSGYVYVTSLKKIKAIHEAECADTYNPNASSSCFVYTENLYRGMRKVEIKAAQKALQASVAPNLKADGVFGPGTEKAVKAFQALHDVRQSGGIGPLTGAELEKVVCQI